MPRAVPALLRIRVVKTFNAGNSEITSDLPHLHQAHIERAAFQPGNPGSTALGSFTVPLHPPGTRGYKLAKAIYDQLDYYNRLEFYISKDGASLGKFYDAGIVTGMPKSTRGTPRFELTGGSDLVLAKKSAPFPGEVLGSDLISTMLKSYLGTNELAFSDTFNPYTAANYTSSNTPGGTAGTWNGGGTDDGFTVISITGGATGAALISKSGGAANDRWHSHFVEVTGRLFPSADATNAGAVGIGLSDHSTDLSTGVAVLGKVTAYKANGQWHLNAITATFSAGVLTSTYPISNVLMNVADADGYISLTIGLLVNTTVGGSTMTLTVNGKVVVTQTPTGWDPGTGTNYAFLHYVAPASGSATAYLTNFTHQTRFTADGPSTASVFAPGSITAAGVSLAAGRDPGPSFLEAWSRFATRAGWYWRYTPQAYVVGSRTLGKVDFGPDPGTDRAVDNSVVFSTQDGSLTGLELTANADAFASGTAVNASPSPDGGGIGFWRDISSMNKYGVIDDQALAMTSPDFNTARRTAYQVVSNKVNLSSAGSKTADVLRTAQTADVWRELDKVRLDHKEMGIYQLSARVLTRTFDEGKPIQTLTLDQFSADDKLLSMKRFQQAAFATAETINRLGSAGGAAAGGSMDLLKQGNNAAAGNQGGFSTINASTWVDITNSSFNLIVTRPSFFIYFVYACARITAGAQTGYVRGNIVGFDTSAKLLFDSANKTNGTMMYFPVTQGPIQPGIYTVKMQVATDANTTTLNIDQFFHVIFLSG